MGKQFPPKWLNRKTLPRWSLVALLLALAGGGALPGYLKQYWSWSEVGPLADDGQSLIALRKKGLTLPGWQNHQHEIIWLGSHRWSLQELSQGDRPPIVLLMLPQAVATDKPEVEWTDVNGAENWKTEAWSPLKFPVDVGGPSPVSVTARFFRAWNQRQTFAVVQWYAWPDGGDFSPAQWFWQDQWAQLRGTRQPWVAVCLKIPIDPLEDLDRIKPFATEIATIVQKNLVAGPLATASTPDKADSTP